jgi:K+-sensing histidine kinase KdpD
VLWIPASNNDKMKRRLNIDRLSPRGRHTLDTLIGTLLCASVATLMSLIFSGTSVRSTLPLLFIAVLFVAALRYGAVSGIFGGVVAALIFAYFLFTPVGSFRVERSPARDNLGWMLLVGIPLSYFVATSREDAELKKD